MKFINLLDHINKDWSSIEKARYLYQAIAKNISYDEKFMYGTDQEKLRKIYDRKIDITREENTKLVCRTANEVYVQLLQALDIKAKLVYKKPKVKRPIEVQDTALVFWDENGNKYFTNIIGDIENCRYDLKTFFFGITKNEYEEAQDAKEILEEKLKQIDLKIGYIKKDYSDIVFNLIIDEVKNTNNFKKFLKSQGMDIDNLTRDDVLKNKLIYINKLIKFRDKTAGEDERKKFYQRLFCASAIDKFESKKFEAFEYFKNESYVSVIQLNLTKYPVYYIYSQEEQSYVQILPEELKEKLKGYQERKGKKLVIEQETKSR